MNTKTLIIAGMHRSGTSLITQWLHRCGLPVGHDLFPADVGNVEGHFEDVDFLDMHRQFLSDRHCPDTGFVREPLRPLTPAEKRQVQQLLAIKNREHGAWGWKEPRTCLFLDVYNELAPDAFYLFVIRDFHATVNSMLAREYKVHMKKFRTKKGLSKLKWILFKKKPIERIYARHAEEFVRIWIFYYEQILKLVKTLPGHRYQFVNYGWLADDDSTVFGRLIDDWKFPLQYIPFTAVYKKELLSEIMDVEKYVADKSLLARARSIENECAVYLEMALPEA